MQTKSKKVIVIGAVCMAVIIVVLGAIYFATRPQGQEGDKTISFSVISAQGDTVGTYDIETSEEFLRGALENESLIEGEEGEYGLYVLTVDGITADESKQEWWCFTKGGETLNTGVDSTPIADGDCFEATLMVGW